MSRKDQNNFSYIINRYKLKFFHYVRRISGVNDDDAEDLVQDIFIKIYLNINDFDETQKFSSWAYAIARNLVISNYRKRKVRPENYKINLDDDLMQNIASEINIEKEFDQLALKDYVVQVMTQMPEKYREVLILKYFEEKNYQEISDIIKKPIGTVGSMINKAKKELTKSLDKKYD
ncbi:MAG: RNA polymerase sigma factor [Patescibacteria group bacterium]|nr:RNA polymerase sigma factor [Patescibacteria group bacterium]